MEHNELTYLIRGAIFEVYNTLGPGLLESVYEEALSKIVNFIVTVLTAALSTFFMQSCVMNR